MAKECPVNCPRWQQHRPQSQPGRDQPDQPAEEEGQREQQVERDDADGEGQVGRRIARAYERGLIRFYELMYGDDRVVEGFKTVGDSFYHSGFYEIAINCYDEGEQYLQGIPPNAKRTLDPGYKDTRDHFRRHRKKAQKHLEALEEGSTL